MSDEPLSRSLQQFVGLPVRDFVLHRDPMLLLDRITAIGADHATCEWLCGESAFLEPGKGIPAYIGIEYMAQCIAVHAGARARLRGLGPPLGFLLGTRQFKTSVSWFEPGETYESVCREIVRDSQGMASFACELRHRGEAVATANLAVLERSQSASGE